jgi:hypothetical protein
VYKLVKTKSLPVEFSDKIVLPSLPFNFPPPMPTGLEMAKTKEREK